MRQKRGSLSEAGSMLTANAMMRLGEEDAGPVETGSVLTTNAKTPYCKRVGVPAKLGCIASCPRVGFAFGAAHVQFLRCEVCLASTDDARLVGSDANGPVCLVDARFGRANFFCQQ